MQFKDLEWMDVVSDGVIICSTYELHLCGWINMKFKINHDPEDDKYILMLLVKAVSGDCSLKNMVP